jgi:hypothetical protein
MLTPTAVTPNTSGDVLSLNYFFDLTAHSKNDSPYPRPYAEVHSPSSTLDSTIPVSYRLHVWSPESSSSSSLDIGGVSNLPHSNRCHTESFQVDRLTTLFPICKEWALSLPNVTFLGISFNARPFSIQEHVLITIKTIVCAGSAYALGTKFW